MRERRAARLCQGDAGPDAAAPRQDWKTRRAGSTISSRSWRTSCAIRSRRSATRGRSWKRSRGRGSRDGAGNDRRQSAQLARIATIRSDVTRITRGTLTIRRRRQDVRDIIAHAWRRRAGIVISKHTVELQDPEGEHFVDATRTRLPRRSPMSSTTPRATPIRAALSRSPVQRHDGAHR